MKRIPLLTGSRISFASLGADAVLLKPPASRDPLRDVGAAVGEALRYPLSGQPLPGLVTAGGRAAIVVEPRALPLPGAQSDPRQDAVAAVIEELERLGMPAELQTIVVAGGLERRAGRRELETILRPLSARDYRGSVVVHDAASPDLRTLELEDGSAVGINPAVRDADLIVTVTAAETSERGGDRTLLAACTAEAILSVPPSSSLLSPSSSPAGVLGGKIASALAARCALIGVSIVLDHPRLTGRYADYPAARALAALGRSPLRALQPILPGLVRARLLESVSRVLQAVAVLSGPPAVAHAEALLRGVALRGTEIEAPFDTVVIPLPWFSAHVPREPLNPITAAALGLGHALRLWRDASPLRPGGTAILLHDFRRTFGEGSQAPYRMLFHALRERGGDGSVLDEARAAAALDVRALAAYREGAAVHPLLPFADWASCAPALAQAGRVIVAPCRDAGAARALGLVPSHSLGAADEMARGVAGGSHRLGVMVAPPYVPLIVGHDGG